MHIFYKRAGFFRLPTKLNNRGVEMVKLYNAYNGTDVPLTEKGYHSIGRSTGILSNLSKPDNFEKFCRDKKEFILKLISDNENFVDKIVQFCKEEANPSDIVKNYLLSIGN